MKTNLLSWGYIFLYMNALNSLTFQSIVHVLYLNTFILYLSYEPETWLILLWLVLHL